MDTRSYKTLSANASTVEKKWLLVDVEGKVVGRAAAEIAKLLRGKHKPYFTPHVDCGDNVIVINAGKVRFTGNKWSDKVYIRHSGYPGGQRSMTAKEVLSKDPVKIMESAIKGMLPKSKLGKKLFGNLRVYAGGEHQHEAQEPQAFEI